MSRMELILPPRQGAAVKRLPTIVASSALVVLCSAVTASSAPATECDGWHLNGYWLGMSRDEANAVRALGKPHKRFTKALPRGWTAFEVKSEAIDGIVIFDADDTLAQWLHTLSNANLANLRFELAQRFGEPTDEFGTPGESAASPAQTHAVHWTNPDCDIVITLGSYAPPGLNTVIVSVGMERLSKIRERGSRYLD